MKAARSLLPKHWPETLQSFIGGRFVPVGANAELYSNVYAAAGQVLNQYEIAQREQVDQAVEAAIAAQKEWAKQTPIERGKILRKIASVLEERNDELAALEAIDTSRPIQETLEVDIVSAKDCFEFYGNYSVAISGEFIDMPNSGGSFAYTRREPIGVCGGIGAWNYPIQGMAWKLAPALVCGNALIFKPAEDTPLTALALAEITKECGLPDGLFNVVLGTGEVGHMLSSHPKLDKISFTGSVPTGKAICKAAAENLKNVTMELGGKSPMIVFEDSDIEDAVSAAMMANFYSNGEVCSNGTRVFVQNSIIQKFTDRLVERTKKLKIGDPLDKNTEMSALINEKHLNRVLDYIDVGKNEGAKLLVGGEREKVEGLEGGVYMSAAVFGSCDDSMRVVKEEIFGPVACILGFDTEEEVVERANDTVFGLAAGVFTNDIKKAHRVVHQLKAGCTWINNYNLAPVELPWGGFKQSGIGRENGKAGIENWSQWKSVYVEMDKVWCPYE